MAQGVCLSLYLSLALTTGLVISCLRTQKRETLLTGLPSNLAHVIRRRKPYYLQMLILPEYGPVRTRDMLCIPRSTVLGLRGGLLTTTATWRKSRLCFTLAVSSCEGGISTG